jgi:hypothetical protein
VRAGICYAKSLKFIENKIVFVLAGSVMLLREINDWAVCIE